MSTEERSVNQPEEQPSLSEQRLIRRAKLKELQDAGQDPFQITKFVVKHHSADIKEGFEALEGAMTSVAGRIMSKRGMGKAVFCDLQDGKGRIQLYVRVDELGEEAFAKFKKTDIGDIVGVEGEVFKTKRGEISVKAHKVTLLSKSLQPLPEKFHGLTDKEMRYRQRYVDLIMNEDVRRTLSAPPSSSICAGIWTSGTTWRWRPLSSTPSPVAPPPGPSSPTTTPWTSTCICASPPSCP